MIDGSHRASDADVAPSQPRYDLSDWLVLMMIAVSFLASWVYVWVHPSDIAFGVCVGGVGTFGGLFQYLRIKDDKIPDRKDA